MKAISPALPTTPPARHSNDSDASATDEAFGALIAAVIGAPAPRSAPQQATATSSANSAASSPRVDKTDDARPVAATSRQQQETQRGAGPDRSDAKDAADKPGHDVKQAAAPKAASAAGSATVSPEGSTVPAGLERAADMLATALAKAPGDAAKNPTAAGNPVGPKAQPQVAAQPGSALTEGQLPAQLVAAVTAAHAEAPAASALNIKTDVKPADGKAVDAKTADTAGTPGAGKLPAQEAPVAVTPLSTDTVKNVAPQPPAVTTAQAAQQLASTDNASSDTASSDIALNSAAKPAPTARPNDAKANVPDHPAVADTTSSVSTQLPPQVAPVATPLHTATLTAPQQAQPQQPYPSGLVSQQVVQVLVPLRTAKDGDYTLSLQLHPAELGAVTVRVEVQQGVLSVQMSADHAHGHDALSQSVADLRTQLQASGVRTGDIAVIAAKPSSMSQLPQHQDQHHHAGGRHQQGAPMHDDAGSQRRPNEQAPRHPTAYADDDTLDVRL